MANIRKSYQWLEKDRTEALILAAQEQALGTRSIEAGVYTEQYNQVTVIVYRNICSEYGLDPPKSSWETLQKIVENNRAKLLWDSPIQTERKVLANQPDIVVIDKQKKDTVVTDIAVTRDSNIKKKEYEKLKYQGLKEEPERTWQVKAKVVPVMIGALGAVAPKLEEWLQQIPGTTSELSVQKSVVLGTVKILRRTLKLPGLW